MNEKPNAKYSEFEQYFKEDLDAIEEELKKSKEYSEIIDSEIKNLKATAIGMVKGNQRYLIDHIHNAVELQTQRQSLRRDKFAIKKAIIEYTRKEGSDTSGEFEELLNKLIQSDRKNKVDTASTTPLNEQNLDDEIDKLLGE